MEFNKGLVTFLSAVDFSSAYSSPDGGSVYFWTTSVDNANYENSLFVIAYTHQKSAYKIILRKPIEGCIFEGTVICDGLEYGKANLTFFENKDGNVFFKGELYEEDGTFNCFIELKNAKTPHLKK